jgi:hypothetical protein
MLTNYPQMNTFYEMWSNLHCVQIMEHTLPFKVKTSIFKIENMWFQTMINPKPIAQQVLDLGLFDTMLNVEWSWIANAQNPNV